MGMALATLLAVAPVAAQVPAGSSTAAPAQPATPASEDNEIELMFRAGTEALAGGRAAEAIANLEALGDRGVVDPVVSFDRGLAYAARVRAGLEQPGDLGRAAHGFEEARELSHDSALVRDANDALVAVRAEVAKRRSRAGDPIEVENGVSLGRSIVKLLPENVWAYLAALAAAALAVGIVLRARSTRPRLKVAGTTTASIGAGVLLACAICLYSARDIRRHARDAVVVAPSARLLDAQHVVISSQAALPEAARIQLLDETADFAHVIAGRTEGWLPSSSVLPLAK